MTKMLKRMQTIDFTDIDVGTLGHRIPVEVLASLSEHGCPGKNLKMCVARPLKKFTVSTISSYASSTNEGTTTTPTQANSGATKNTTEKAELPNNMQAADSPDGVIKIEHIKHWPTVPVVGTFIKYRPRIRLLLTKDWSLR